MAASSPPPDQKDAENAVATLLRFIGEDPSREALRKTPARFLKFLEERCASLGKSPDGLLGQGCPQTPKLNGLIALTNFRFRSLCEHHLAEIEGVAFVGYTGGEKTPGLSRLADMARFFSLRPQTQERMAHDIGQYLEAQLRPTGCAVALIGRHSCLIAREPHNGQNAAVLFSSYYGGAMRKSDNPERLEFNALLAATNHAALLDA